MPRVPPIHESIGICLTSPEQNESMVWTFRRLGFSSNRQSCMRFRFRAIWASSKVLRWCSDSGGVSLWAISSASKIRFFISPAALRVKVMLRICSGYSTPPSSFRKRWMSSSVFPDPAGACTRKERVGSSAFLLS